MAYVELALFIYSLILADVNNYFSYSKVTLR